MKVEVKSKKGLRTILSVIVDKKNIQTKMDERLKELQKEYDLILRYYPETPFLDDLNKKMDNVNSELKKITTTSITP